MMQSNTSRDLGHGLKRVALLAFYLVATVQFVWCYLWITRAYVSTSQYEQGTERMPFQGRVLMMFPMRWAHHSQLLAGIASPFSRYRFWFPRPIAPEVIVQGAINVVCLLVAGWAATSIYRAASRRRLLTPLVYPLLLVVAAATYMFHTVQNFRFIYDLPSLAFFSVAMYLIYFRRHWAWFAAMFLIATVNRETTLLLLPLYLINEAVAPSGTLRLDRVLRLKPLALCAALAVCWSAWQILIHRHFAGNVSELYPRLNWNIKSLLAPIAWPQLLSAGGYLLLLVVLLRRRIPDPRLRAWLWLFPLWLAFMFVYGILIETRIYGELIPIIVCASALICEEVLVARMRLHRTELILVEPPAKIHEAA